MEKVLLRGYKQSLIQQDKVRYKFVLEDNDIWFLMSGNSITVQSYSNASFLHASNVEHDFVVNYYWIYINLG